jgi:DNA-binding MarR family transcriptional regulator
MTLAPLEKMSFGEIAEYVEALEGQVKTLTKKTDNAKKLLPQEVRRIRLLWNTGNWTQAELAEAFMVNPGTISRIVRGEYHKDI